MSEETVLNLEEAAHFCRVSPRTLRDSDAPRSRIGRRIVFLKSELVLYVEQRATHSLKVAS